MHPLAASKSIKEILLILLKTLSTVVYHKPEEVTMVTSDRGKTVTARQHDNTTKQPQWRTIII